MEHREKPDASIGDCFRSTMQSDAGKEYILIGFGEQGYAMLSEREDIQKGHAYYVDPVNAANLQSAYEPTGTNARHEVVSYFRKCVDDNTHGREASLEERRDAFRKASMLLFEAQQGDLPAA